MPKNESVLVRKPLRGFCNEVGVFSCDPCLDRPAGRVPVPEFSEYRCTGIPFVSVLATRALAQLFLSSGHRLLRAAASSHDVFDMPSSPPLRIA